VVNTVILNQLIKQTRDVHWTEQDLLLCPRATLWFSIVRRLKLMIELEAPAHSTFDLLHDPIPPRLRSASEMLRPVQTIDFVEVMHSQQLSETRTDVTRLDQLEAPTALPARYST
jgi:hypothetical protein